VRYKLNLFDCDPQLTNNWHGLIFLQVVAIHSIYRQVWSLILDSISVLDRFYVIVCTAILDNSYNYIIDPGSILGREVRDSMAICGTINVAVVIAVM